MTAVPASAITIVDTRSDPTNPSNPTHALANRLREHLQTLAALRVAISYRDLAKAMLLSPPRTIHQLTEALEQLMAEDAAADCPFIAAIVVSDWRGGMPAPGFFDCAARLGRFAGDATGVGARAFHAGEFNASVALWAGPARVMSTQQRGSRHRSGRFLPTLAA